MDRLFSILHFICIVSFVNSDSPSCNPGFTLLHNYCYKVFINDNGVTWLDADVQCRTNNDNVGAELVTINHQNWPFVSDLVKNITAYEDYWIGLRMRCPGSPFTWYDGTSPSTFHWEAGQPKPTTNATIKYETCVKANAISNHWTVTSCNIPYDTTYKTPGPVKAYVCQMPKVNYTIPDPILPQGSCGGNWCRSRQWCYRLVNNDRAHQLEYLNAERNCQGLDGHLVSIHDHVENQFVQDTIDFGVGDPRLSSTSRQILIGLSLLDSQDETYFWTDHTPFDYFPWAPGQPDSNNIYNRESCVEMFDLAVGTVGQPWDSTQHPDWVGKWNDMVCDEIRPFVCKKWAPGETPIGSTVTPPISGGCRPGWMQFDNRCFKVFGGKNDPNVPRLNHRRANEYCQQTFSGIHTALVSIRNVYEQLFIESLLKTTGESIWIGAFFDKGVARWTDETLMSYTNWESAPGTPTDKSCVFMNYGETAGKWDIVPPTTYFVGKTCDSSLPFVCVETLNHNFPTRQPYEGFSGCNEPGYTKFGDGCFKFFDAAQSWEAAEAECASDTNTHLVSMDDSFDFAFLTSLGRSSGYEDFWIGLKQTAAGDISWVNGYPLTFSKWGSNEPLQDPTKQCYAMTLNDEEGALWKSESCTTRKPFICNKRQDPPVINNEYLPGTCSSGWTEISRGCVHLNKAMVSYNGAYSICQNADPGSKLASFHSSNDTMTIVKSVQLQGVTGVLIGLHQGGSGLDGYAWDDRSPLDYTNWAHGQPEYTNAMKEEQCVYMDDKGQWHDTNCENNKYFILCQKPKDAVPTPTTTTKLTTKTTANADPGTASTASGGNYSTPMSTVPVNGSTVQQSITTSKPGLSGGAIAGIIISVLLVGLIGTLGFLMWKGIIPIIKLPNTPRLGLPHFMDSNGNPGDNNLRYMNMNNQ